ncbi:MAG: hypothetical protein AAF362_09450 [Pseudomonadota bacterium]
MKRAFQLLFLALFVVISTIAIHDNANASEVEWTQSTSKEIDGECACKASMSTLNLVCGVTLALLDEAQLASLLRPSSRLDPSLVANSDLDLVWKLKRPPRS